MATVREIVRADELLPRSVVLDTLDLVGETTRVLVEHAAPSTPDSLTPWWARSLQTSNGHQRSADDHPGLRQQDPERLRSAPAAAEFASEDHQGGALARAAGPVPAAGSAFTFLGERYRRIARRRGSKRAIVAISRSIMVIAWHLLSDPGAQFHDLGPGFYAARIDPERRKRTHVRQLEALGYTVTLQPAA